MKTLFRRVFIYTFGLFLMQLVIPGLNITGGIWMMIFCGVILTLMFLIIKPILNLLTLPVNMMTLGLFSIFNSALILYLLTVFVSAITIQAFVYPRIDLLGVIIPTLTFNTFLAYIYSAFVLSFIDSTLSWLMN
jgi:putative membrane protein